MLSFKSGTPDEIVAKVLELYNTLQADCGGKEAGILFFKVDYNLDQRKGWRLAEFATFSGTEALDAFRVHPCYKAVTDILREHADWVVGDLLVDGVELASSLESDKKP